jgi:type VI secretion system protein ImpF
MISRLGRDRGGEQRQRPQLPLLDRLIDDAPDVERDTSISLAEAAALLRRSVRRDIEALLNARRRWRSWPEGYDQLAVSPVGYGITDFAAGAFNDPGERDRLRLQIERTIQRFEPRLAQVHVVLIDGDNTLDPTLRLRIEALLRVDPAPEPITFDTLVDPATSEVQVKPNTAERQPSDV